MQKDVFITNLHHTANPRIALKAVNPELTEGQATHGDSLINDPIVEERMLWVLEEEKRKAIEEAAKDVVVTLLTIEQKRAMIARRLMPDFKTKKHVKMRNMVVEVFEEITHREFALLVRLDDHLETKMQKLQKAAGQVSNEPIQVTVPGIDLRSPIPAPEPPRTEEDPYQWREGQRYQVYDVDPFQEKTVYRAEKPKEESVADSATSNNAAPAQSFPPSKACPADPFGRGDDCERSEQSGACSLAQEKPAQDTNAEQPTPDTTTPEKIIYPDAWAEQDWSGMPDWEQAARKRAAENGGYMNIMDKLRIQQNQYIEEQLRLGSGQIDDLDAHIRKATGKKFD